MFLEAMHAMEHDRTMEENETQLLSLVPKQYPESKLINVYKSILQGQFHNVHSFAHLIDIFFILAYDHKLDESLRDGRTKINGIEWKREDIALKKLLDTNKIFSILEELIS